MTAQRGGVEELVARATAAGCPIDHTDFRSNSELYEHYEMLEASRSAGRVLVNDTTDHGFWMIQQFEDVLAVLQKPDTFTTDVTSAFTTTRSETTPLLPQMLNGDEHTRMRRVLNPFFSPASVRRMDEFTTQCVVNLLDEIAPRGECDFIADFARRFPTDVFLGLLGLPIDDRDFFQHWSDTLFETFFTNDVELATTSRDKLLDYFEKAVTDRRADPLDPKTDLMSRLIAEQPDGSVIEHEDVLTICMTLMLAGLDTTKSALGYIYAHLATHESERRLITDDPKTMPAMIEEFIRLYPLVFQAGREAQDDIDLGGIPVEKGDVLWVGLAQANRDPERFPEPDQFVLNRPGIQHHLGFGGGPHRCLGMHLAKREITIALQEWHARIPDYRIPEGVRLLERGGQLTLPSLPLEWSV